MNNDKTLVIIAVFTLAVMALITLGTGGKEIVSNVVAGLLGLAMGQRLNGDKNA